MLKILFCSQHKIKSMYNGFPPPKLKTIPSLSAVLWDFSLSKNFFIQWALKLCTNIEGCFKKISQNQHKLLLKYRFLNWTERNLMFWNQLYLFICYKSAVSFFLFLHLLETVLEISSTKVKCFYFVFFYICLICENILFNLTTSQWIFLSISPQRL